MGTIIYGASDDLIEIFLFLSDGTILEVKYGKENLAVWEIKLVEKGIHFDTIEPCFDEDADRYSDTAKFHFGLKWVYAADSIGKVE